MPSLADPLKSVSRSRFRQHSEDRTASQPKLARLGSASPPRVRGEKERKKRKEKKGVGKPMQLYRGDKSLPLARRWPLGRGAVVVGPHPNLAGVGLPSAGARAAGAGLARQKMGPRRAGDPAVPKDTRPAAPGGCEATHGPRSFLWLLLAFLRVLCSRRRLPLLLEVSLMRGV